MMCCKLAEAENVERIFSIFFCEQLHKPVSQKLRGLYRWEDLGWKSVQHIAQDTPYFLWIVVI